MSESFRVDHDPWVPVHALDGHATCVGLRDLFTNAHLYRSIGGPGWTPLALSALYRVLTAITYRVTGLAPTDLSADDWDREWRKIAQTGHFNPLLVDGYFDQYTDRWDLFDANRPWLQDPRLPVETRADAKDLNQIVGGDPSDKGAVLRGGYHASDKRTMTPAQALPHLLSVSYYHSGGTLASRYGTGAQAHLASKQPGMAPARATISFHPVGATVFATLLAHLVYPGHPEIPSTSSADLAPWERESLDDPSATFPALNGVVETVTARAKRSYLFSHTGNGSIDGVWIAPRHLTKPDADSHVRDPFVSYKLETPKKDGATYWSPLQGDLTRRPWRDLDSFLASAGGSQERDYDSPLALRDGITRWAVLGPVTAALHVADQETGKDIDKGSYVDILPIGDIPTVWGAAANLVDSVRLFKHSHDLLRQTLRKLASDSGDKGGAKNQAGKHLAEAGSSGYWSAATVRFDTSIADYLSNPEVARADARRIALEQFDLATARHLRNPQSQFAVTRQRHFLRTHLGKQDS